MKILVTGGAGFIGNNLIRTLLADSKPPATKEKIDILNLDSLTYAADLRAQGNLVNDPRYRLAEVDLQDAARVQSTIHEFQPDWIIHLAAESHVDRSVKDPTAFIQTNIVGTFNLLQAARTHFDSLPRVAQSSFRFLHVSTDEVYGSLADANKFLESTPYAPNSPYAASKAAADHLARAWFATYGLPVITIHASNNFGPFQHREKLIPKVIQKAVSGAEIPIYGDGSNTRDWLYVDDCISALLLAIAKGIPGDTYNVGASNERSNLYLVNQICQMLDEIKRLPDSRSYAEQIQFVPDRPGHDFRYAVDASKIRQTLGWVPRYDFDAALHETVKWYLQDSHWAQKSGSQ